MSVNRLYASNRVPMYLVFNTFIFATFKTESN